MYFLASLPDSSNILITVLKASQDVQKWMLVTE